MKWWKKALIASLVWFVLGFALSGGSLVAGNRSDRQGAVFTISVPVPKPAQHLETAA